MDKEIPMFECPMFEVEYFASVLNVDKEVIQCSVEIHGLDYVFDLPKHYFIDSDVKIEKGKSFLVCYRQKALDSWILELQNLKF